VVWRLQNIYILWVTSEGNTQFLWYLLVPRGTQDLKSEKSPATANFTVCWEAGRLKNLCALLWSNMKTTNHLSIQHCQQNWVTSVHEWLRINSLAKARIMHRQATLLCASAALLLYSPLGMDSQLASSLINILPSLLDRSYIQVRWGGGTWEHMLLACRHVQDAEHGPEDFTSFSKETKGGTLLLMIPFILQQEIH